ncbi:hypothetical protein ACJMK2_006064 [Sinanodonta woodiana]|uniref:Nucleolar complex protein 3 homolog n=1 Tax=Sinanodonta woodiana TaxID=1069815 RepID=A0ABD3VS05_SINWO
MGVKSLGLSKAKQRKISKTKISNKKQGKLAKQEKLREKRKKKLRLLKRLKGKDKLDNDTRERNLGRIPNVQKREEDVPPDDEDYEYYRTPGRDYSFASSVETSLIGEHDTPKSKSKKRKNDFEEENEYERLPRKLLAREPKQMKMLLPIKTHTGIIPQMIEHEEEEQEVEKTEDIPNGDANGDAVESHDERHDQLQSEPIPLPALSSLQLFALRRKKLQERKMKIANLSNAVIENPEENTKKLKELVGMLEESDPDVYVTVRKLVMVSLMEIFKDIVPGYKIRLLTDQEKQQKMKRETKILQDYEDSFLRSYKKYLEFLESIAKGWKKPQEKYHREKNKSYIPIPAKAEKGLKEISVRCMSAMLVNHPHFNFRNNLITFLVPFMNDQNPKISDVVCEAVKAVFRTDKLGEATLELVKCIGNMIKAQGFSVQTKVLDTFLSLKIKEINSTQPGEKTEAQKKKDTLKNLSRREKRHKKEIQLLEIELLETKATEDQKRKLKLHTDIIQTVFLTYFRILKKAQQSILLPSVLEGLAKFAHLINVEFFNDLFKVFNQLIDSDDLPYRESLHCIQTAFTILSDQGSVFRIDPIKFYKHLYKHMFHVHAGTTSDDLPIMLDCLQVMVTKHKRQVSQHRILAFLKRLCTLVLQQTSSGAAGLLPVIRSILMTYNYCDILFDNEAQGNGLYLPELEDPEHCNAQNTMLWELSYLNRHYHPVIQKFGNHISRRAPSTGEGQLSADLSRKEPMMLYEDILLKEREIFPSSLPMKSKKKCKAKKIRGISSGRIEDQVYSGPFLSSRCTKQCANRTPRQNLECWHV